MEIIWQSEIDPYACKVLSKHWPKVPNHGNIKNIHWGNVVRPDILCGGYPCQPFSSAGKRNGANDPRHLWPWVREAISELRPKYAILENVRGHITLGLSTVLGELASIGYDAEWQIVSANSVGAPHLRERVIIIAHPFRELANTDNSGQLQRQPQIFTAHRWLNALNLTRSSSTNVADTHSISGHIEHQRQVLQPNFAGCSWWQTEPNVGRVADGIPHRVDRLRGLGNSVVPQVAELVGRMVIDYDTNI